MAKKKARKKAVRAQNKERKSAKRAPRRTPFDDIEFNTKFPRWIVREMISGMKIRADFLERGGNWASSALLKQEALRLEKLYHMK